MRTACINCTRSFDKAYRKGMTDFIPSVCSSDCMAQVVHSSKYARYQEFHLDKTSTKIYKFKERSITYRSSYEEKFAKWLFRNELTFLFEPYTFYLSNGSRYVPDFYIPKSAMFIETKGIWHKGAKQKVRLFSEEFSYPLYVVDREMLKLLNKKKEV